MFVEKVEEKEKKETQKGWTPFGLEEEVDGVLGTVAKTLPPRFVVVADVAVAFAAAVAVLIVFVVVVVVAVAFAVGVVFAAGWG